MILWFSGTGNSRAVAEQLAAATGDSALPLAHSAGRTLTLGGEEALGIVVPVYGWGVPVVAKFLLRTLLVRTEGETLPYVYVVLTCGDDVGRTDREVRRLLFRARLALRAVWSVQLPNTYVSLPGFDVDATAVADAKLAAARQRLAAIATAIVARREVVDVVPGAFPWLKSRVLGAFFNRFLIADHRFRATSACTACRRCVAVCPMHNIISDTDGRPQWKGHCTACLACYHHCPQHAIAYGRFTKGKGQYVFRKGSL